MIPVAETCNIHAVSACRQYGTVSDVFEIVIGAGKLLDDLNMQDGTYSQIELASLRLSS